MLISFEGIDGSGKSTQARLLSQSLKDLGHTVVDVREPGGTLLGEQVRDILLDTSSVISPLAELFLFSAARAQLTTDVIVPSLKDGHIVIADRFFDSTIAYQGAGRGLASPEQILKLQRLATSGLEPDLTYFVDTPLEVAATRRGKSIDRIESAGIDFYRRVLEGYRALSMSNRRVRTLVGTLPIDVLAETILEDALDSMNRN